jgi:heterodisulfide reductase subunit A-like polyferredoxin/coenzyme F420-reducing hydrogenase delta subunit
MNEDLRLGVMICECGDQIGSNLDLDALAGQVNEFSGVATTRRLRYGCSPDGLASMQSAIAEEDLDTVLVAGCTPRTLEPRFRAACEQGGLDGDRFKLVDIREGCAWVHPNDVEAATLKAADLIRMGAAELSFRKPHTPATVEVLPSALVIGGGVAGISAALTLADEGIPVKLVEREASIGGPMRKTANGSVAAMSEAVLEHPQVEVLLEKKIAEVSGAVGRYSVSVTDVSIHENGALEFDVGAIVIATDARSEVDALAYKLGIPQDENGFLPSARYRLRPGNYADRGIYVCGAPHGLSGEKQAEFEGVSAALSALGHLAAGTVTNEAPAAVVDQDLCTGCASCVAACPFVAISMQSGPGLLDLARVDPILCSACGNCTVACPSKAIELPFSSDATLFSQIEAALVSRSTNGQPCVLVFGCEWSGQVAAELAGAHRLNYSSGIRSVRMECSTRFDPTFALWAFHHGAEGVLLTACRPGKCHHVGSNRNAQNRIETLRSQLSTSGFDSRRLRLEWVQPDDPEAYVDKVSRFSDLMAQITPRRSLVE